MTIKSVLLNIEVVLALALAWALVFVAPFRWTCWLFGAVSAPRQDAAYGDAAYGDAVNGERGDLARAWVVTRRLKRAADRLPWSSTCLVRALAARILLARRGVRGATVRLGVRKEEGRIEAHAWLVLGATILLGGDGAETFEPLADLGSEMSLRNG